MARTRELILIKEIEDLKKVISEKDDIISDLRAKYAALKEAKKEESSTAKKIDRKGKDNI